MQNVTECLFLSHTKCLQHGFVVAQRHSVTQCMLHIVANGCCMGITAGEYWGMWGRRGKDGGKVGDLKEMQVRATGVEGWVGVRDNAPISDPKCPKDGTRCGPVQPPGLGT